MLKYRPSEFDLAKYQTQGVFLWRFMSGYIALHRKILDWQWWGSVNHRVLFLELLLRANYKETKWRNEIIAPGQLLTGEHQLSSWTGLTRSKLRTALRDLEMTNEIARKKTSKYSIITVINWQKYQNDRHAIATKSPSRSPSDRHQIATSNKANNSNNINIYPGLTDKIIDYLNQKAGTSYKSKTKSTISKINARLNEGYVLSEFEAVIDHKCSEWKYDDRFFKFLRPETLFGNKFESYLQVAKSQPAEKKLSDDFKKLLT